MRAPRPWLRRLSPAAFAAAVLAHGVAHAAPDEDLLGRADGYPLCPKSLRPEPRCLVGLVSRFDEVFPARVVERGAWVWPLRRAAAEPALRYRHGNETGGIDDYLARNRATGLLVVAGDTILVERYQYDRTAAHRMQSYSMAKTVVAMLVGIAVADGRIRSVDDLAEAYVPELRDTPYGRTRLRHLLTMSSGVRFSETYSGFDDVALLGRLSLLGESAGGAATLMPFRTRERPSGERFHYASADTQVLGLVLRGATGRTLADYLSEKIWQPMGAEANASWIVDAGGYEAAYVGINATLRDWGRLGMLLANDGAVAGRQVIPAAWVRAATTPSAKPFEPGMTGLMLGYGYQTWIIGGGDREFVLRGLRGQAIYVAPKTKLVMVQTSAGNVATPSTGELLSLWIGVQRSLAGTPPH
ncbi:MAG: serine hydrolase [Betaproteobacteria bacterium]|nr:serine hydrolase [Betaproteobacteria bacterium]MCC7217201.1 serine hydrolase [Burkholderiales bacterium]